jgi:hypothetical protein
LSRSALTAPARKPAVSATDRREHHTFTAASADMTARPAGEITIEEYGRGHCCGTATWCRSSHARPGAFPVNAEAGPVTERLRAWDQDDEGRRLVRIVRRDSGPVVTWRRLQMVLLSAQGMDVAGIAPGRS